MKKLESYDNLKFEVEFEEGKIVNGETLLIFKHSSADMTCIAYTLDAPQFEDMVYIGVIKNIEENHLEILPSIEDDKLYEEAAKFVQEKLQYYMN